MAFLKRVGFGGSKFKPTNFHDEFRKVIAEKK
jgi:hypothetical protein